MELTECPKCGFEQPEGEECRACGIIFAKYRPYPPSPEPDSSEVLFDEHSPQKGWRYYFRVFRLLSVACAILGLLLIVWPTSPPRIQIDPASAARASHKVREFTAAAQNGKAGNLEMNEAELNAWLGTILDLPSSRAMETRNPESSHQNIGLAGYDNPSPETLPSREEVQSNVSDVRVTLNGDRVRTHVTFSLYGAPITFQLEGRLRALNGYLRLEPTAGRLGSFPIPAFTLGNAVDRLFTSQENREKFRLPAGIEDIRVVDSQLKVRLKGTQ